MSTTRSKDKQTADKPHETHTDKSGAPPDDADTASALPPPPVPLPRSPAETFVDKVFRGDRQRGCLDVVAAHDSLDETALLNFLKQFVDLCASSTT